MNKLIITVLSSLFAFNVALAQTTATPAKVEEKKAEVAKGSASCADKAAEKKLAGAAKNSFVKKCEKDSPVATPVKTNTRTAQREKMASCNKDAGEQKLKGTERKKFMSDCLKK